jgi:arylformamidase
MNSQYILLSHVLTSKTPSYGNRDKVYIRKNSSILSGDSANTSSYFISNNHIGTHIDVPNHFSESGLKTFEIPIDQFIFNKIGLIDFNCHEAILIGSHEIKNLLYQIDSDIDLLLIRTGFEKYRNQDKYWNDNPGLAPELADYLRLNFSKLRCIGFDFISLASWKFRQFGKEAHLSFLKPESNEKSLLIIEDMFLSEIKSNLESVIVAPFFIEDGNGGAVTVIAKTK